MLFRYSYEDVRVDDPVGVTERRDAPVRLGRVAASYAIDYRDNPFDATRGRYHTVDFPVASTKLGGSENFFRFFTENQYYRPLTADRRTLMALDFRLGMARRYGELPPVTGIPLRESYCRSQNDFLLEVRRRCAVTILSKLDREIRPTNPLVVMPS